MSPGVYFTPPHISPSSMGQGETLPQGGTPHPPPYPIQGYYAPPHISADAAPSPTGLNFDHVLGTASIFIIIIFLMYFFTEGHQ